MREPPRIASGNRQELEVVRAIAGDQEGIVTRAQLLTAGVGSSAIHRALRFGRLHSLH